MDRPLQNKYDKLKRHHDSLVAAIETLNTGLNRALAENEVLVKQLVNADKFIVIQKRIVIDNLDQSRATEIKLVNEIKALKAKIKALRER